MLFSFAAFLILFLIVGLLAARRSTGKTREDYYLAGRNVKPWAVGLSAAATNNSGYMFIGMVGYTYVNGLSTIWIALGLVVGDFLSSLVIHRRFRQVSEATGEVSYAGVLSSWNNTEYIWLRRLIGLISLAFLLAYASAQFSAANKMLQVTQGFSSVPNAGAIIGFLVVLIYCLWGGVRASIWTDVLQSGLMIISIVTIFVVLLNVSGGIEPALAALKQIPGFLNCCASDRFVTGGLVGTALYAAGWGFCGASVIGQPHIMSRFMTLDDADNYSRVRPWYYLFYIILYTLVLGVGLLARLTIPGLLEGDPELALPIVTMQLLPPILAGVLIAGVYAAAMSTADSQILTCSATLARDLAPGRLDRSLAMKLATLTSATAAFLLALLNHPSIFDLVILAWSAMGAAFAPLLLIYVLGARPTQGQAIAMVLTGLCSAILWRGLGWHEAVYEGMPAILAALGVWILLRMLWKQTSK